MGDVGSSSSLFPPRLRAVGTTEEDARGMLLGSDTHHGLQGGDWAPFPQGTGLKSLGGERPGILG